MKILYAAGNRAGSYFQLIRFLESIKHQQHIVKIAGYRASIIDLEADFTLDALLDFSHPNRTISFNGNYRYYLNEIKRFAPDLIISDFEIYSSIIALELNIKLWQFSPVLLYYGLKNHIKYGLGIYKKYGYLIDKDKKTAAYIKYILRNSDRKFVLSHLCDSKFSNILSNNYEWVRPNFVLSDRKEKLYQVAVTAVPNKAMLSINNSKIILLSPSLDHITNDYEYFLSRCKKFFTDGTAAFLADAFYNQIYSFSLPRYDDIECVIGSFVNEYAKIGSMQITNTNQMIDININNKIKFISNHLETT